MVAEHVTASKCPFCWSKKVFVWAPLVGPFDEVDIECMSCGNTWIVEGDEATQAIKWEYRRVGGRPAKLSDEDAAILDDDGNDIFKDDNKKPDVFTIYVSRLKGNEEPVLDDVAAQARDFVLKANQGYEISQMDIDTKSSVSEIIARVRLRRMGAVLRRTKGENPDVLFSGYCVAKVLSMTRLTKQVDESDDYVGNTFLMLHYHKNYTTIDIFN